MPVDLGQRLTGARVTGLGRRAKYGLIDTDRGDTLVFHLGMSGRWRIDPDGDRQARPSADRDRRRAPAQPQRPAPVRLARPGRDRRARRLAAVRRARARAAGDALTRRNGCSERLAGRKAAIKLLLLDQRIVAGLGNIYVCEALFRARIDPRKAAGGSVSREARRAGGGDPGGARRGDRGGRVDACATSPSPTASSAISPSSSTSMGARASRAAAGAAARSSGSSRAAARPSICPSCQR